MKKLVSLIIAVAILLLFAGEVSAKKFVVCYRVMNAKANAGPGTPCEPIEFIEVYKLNIKKHSPISTRAEETTLKHPRQFVYSVHGKHVGVCGRIPPDFHASVRPVVGTLVTIVNGKKPSEKAGNARMGLETYSTTGCPNWCKDVEISCKSTGDGFPPKSFHCYGQNKYGIEFEWDLFLVNPMLELDCCAFEDGEEDPTVEPLGPASGLMEPTGPASGPLEMQE